MLFSTYLILWIQRFADTGILESRDEGKAIYVRIMVVSAGLAALVFPVFGKLCDTFDPSAMMPIAFIVRCVLCFLFWLLEAPNTLAAHAVCALMVIATVAETITIDTVFYKRLAKETRGVLCGAYSWAG